MDVFYENAQSAFKIPLLTPNLEDYSQRLLTQFRDAFEDSKQCMLPSSTDAFPRGDEEGIFMAIDVGGSTLRIAIVELYGRHKGPSEAIKVVKCTNHAIDAQVRGLHGQVFFEWMAERIQDTIKKGEEAWLRSGAMITGLAWSFPLSQTSISDGNLLQMGKGFQASEGLIGRSLVTLLTTACRHMGFSVDVRAVVNDSSASLLSAAYRDGYAQIALIVGTGLNATMHLPGGIDSVSRTRQSSHELVGVGDLLINTELSMFGRGVFPITKWDEKLRLAHPYPDFQPLEHLTSGRYLGEIVRLVLVDAISTSGLFQGELPCNFGPYQMTSDTITAIESDKFDSLTAALAVMNERHAPNHQEAFDLIEMRHVRNLICLVSSRAAAFVAVSMISLHRLRLEKLASSCTQSARVDIGCSGGVIESYPSFKDRVQATAKDLLLDSDALTLVLNPHSALTGAAVAAACR